MGWLAYVIGIVLLISGFVGWGIFAILFGVLCHWKYWIVGLISGVMAFMFIRG